MEERQVIAICKICEQKFYKKTRSKNHVLKKHLSEKHSNVDIFQYFLVHENLEIPKCLICNKNSDHTKSLHFRKICLKCISEGKFLTDSRKKRISESMKKAHEEGRAWNIGKSRWNNEPSYPEKFFMKVIENEFQDKEYIREYPIGRYSIDFAWPHKKIAIEIDGDQHIRYSEYKERDKKKDETLKEMNWTVIRIVWRDFYKDTKQIISELKKTIDNGSAAETVVL